MTRRVNDIAPGSGWKVLGTAEDVPYAGMRLAPVVSGTHFWFIWSSVKPDTNILVE